MCYNHSLFSRSALVVLHRRGFSKIPTSITQKKDLGPRKFGLNGFFKKMFSCPSEYANIYYNQSRVICLSKKFFFFSRGMSIRIIQSTDWTDAEAPVLWPPDEKSWLPGRDPDASKDWGQEEKGVTEDEIVGWHHRLNGHEFKQTPEIVKDREAWCAAAHGVTKSWTWPSDWTTIATCTDWASLRFQSSLWNGLLETVMLMTTYEIPSVTDK